MEQVATERHAGVSEYMVSVADVAEALSVGMLVDSASPHGIGRLAALDAESAVVRFFKGPSPRPYVDKSMPRTSIAPASLTSHTRVYLPEDDRWKVGRVSSHLPDRVGRYAISFPKQQGMMLSTDDFEVRWFAPVEDPFESLAVLAGDNPVIYRSRLDLIEQWHRQSAAARGVESLFLASAELHDHQLTVVRTVAADPLQRYLLADEVGLGKTIEAGALVARCVRAAPRHPVLVLAPEHLCQQWADELRDKFHCENVLGDTVTISPHHRWHAWPRNDVHMLVVDEAHRLIRSGRDLGESSTRLRELAHGAESVLLLSATPVRSNEAAFLGLLNLLDPESYPHDDIESFVDRVRIRDQVALTWQALTDDLDGFDTSLYADQLAQTFPDDGALESLAQQAVHCEDVERPAAVRRLREHLSRTYRLHHRLLRTRRSPQIGAHFEIRGRWCADVFVIEVDDETDRMRRNLADSFRLYLAEQVETGAIDESRAATAFARMSEACGSAPTALLELADSAHEHTREPSTALFGEWLLAQGDHWRRELRAYESLVMDRLAAELDRLAISKDRGKIVAASAFTSVAEALAGALVRRRGAHRVAAHLGHYSRDEQSEAVERWRSLPECRVLVCDASAEEGINLQTASLIVHLDLPWEAFRMEQRIGRADRFVTDNDLPVESAVVMYGEQPLARNWLAYLREVCGVFDTSVSSLQYTLADIETAMLRRALCDGADALVADATPLKEELAEEARRIVAHDSLDSVGNQHDDLNKRVRAADADRTMASALRTWLEGVGARLSEPHKGTMRIARKPRLLVPFGLEREIAPWLGEELALTRSSAVRHRRPIVRAGHGLFDAVAEHLQTTDRGIAFAFWRPVRGVWPPEPLLRTDFLVRVGENARLRGAAAQEGLADWLTVVVEEAMPPVVESVTVRRDGTEVTDAAGTRPFSQGRGDRNLMSDTEQLAALTAHLDWGALCSRALDYTNAVLARRDCFGKAPMAARAVSEAIEDRLSTLRTRDDVGHRCDTDQQRGLERLAAAVPAELEVVADVLGCGVILCGDAVRMRSAYA